MARSCLFIYQTCYLSFSSIPEFGVTFVPSANYCSSYHRKEETHIVSIVFYFIVMQMLIIADSFLRRLHCLFVEYPYILSAFDGRIHETQVQDAIRGIVDVIQKRSDLGPCTPTVLQEKQPDLRYELLPSSATSLNKGLIVSRPQTQHQAL